MSRPKRSRHPRRSLWPQSGASLLDHYHTRFLLCLAGSLLLVIAVVALPLGSELERIGWRSGQHFDPITIVDMQESTSPEEAREQQREAAPLPTDQPPVVADDDAQSGARGAGASEDAASGPSSSTSVSPDRTIARLATLDPSDHPEMIGGRGALYMHILYPEEALRKGIQGRVVLNFVVTEEGETERIEVAQSLHPLCDSAAVRALRNVRFAPARQNGQSIPVLMKLPIRFQITAPSRVDSTRTADAAPRTRSNQ